MRYHSAVLLALLTSARLHAATPEVRPSLQPLLLVQSEVLTPATFPSGSDFFLEQRDIFVSKDGLARSVHITRFEDKFRTILLNGTSRPSRLNALTRALGAARSGAQGDCQIVNGEPGGGFYDLRWYGRSGRTNKFRVHVSRDSTPGIPACPGTVADLVRAILAFDVALADEPDTEVLVSE